MDTVIRDAKTIAEYKNRRTNMEQQAMRYYDAHRAACTVLLGREFCHRVRVWAVVALPGYERRCRMVLKKREKPPAFYPTLSYFILPHPLTFF